MTSKSVLVTYENDIHSIRSDRGGIVGDELYCITTITFMVEDGAAVGGVCVDLARELDDERKILMVRIPD